MGEIESYLQTHTKADTVYYAEQHGVKLGATDKKLDAAGKERLAQLRKEGAKFKLAKTADPEGYDTTNLHWAISEEIISEKDQAVFWEAIANIRKRRYNSYTRTKHGGYIIETDNVMMFTDADWKAPTLSKVIVFPYGEYVDTSEERAAIRYEAEKYGTTNNATNALERMHGPGFVSEYHKPYRSPDGGENAYGKGTDGRATFGESEVRGVRYGGESGLHSVQKNKLQVGPDTSPRALLANAFEGVVQNDIEKRNLQEYQQKVEQLDKQEARLRELRMFRVRRKRQGAYCFEKWGWSIKSATLGDIAVKRSSIKSEQAHGETAQKVAAIEAIPSVIESGKIINIIDKEGDSFRLVIAAPIKIGKDTYYMGVMLQRNDVHQRLYLHDVVIEKEVSSLPQDILSTTGSRRRRKNLYMTSILDKIRSVKYKEMINQQYMDAVAVGDISLAQKYVDEAALASGAMLFPNGKLKHYYHGTSSAFTSYDMTKMKPGNHGYGIYVTMVKSFASEYGDPVGLYVMTDRIATHDDYDIKGEDVEKLIKHYQLDLGSTVLKYAESVDAWVKNTDDCTILQKLQEFIVGNTKTGPDDMLKYLRKRFSYDGLRVNRETVIWGNRLIKSSAPVVRDETGNIIPLTERFDTDESDIRYSLPVGEDTSPRALLANALKSVAQNDIEKRNLQEYQQKVEQLDKQEARLRELRMFRIRRKRQGAYSRGDEGIAPYDGMFSAF